MRATLARSTGSLLLTMAFLAVPAFASPADKGGDAAAVRAVVEKFVASFDRKDAAAIDALLVKDPDPVTFGTDAAEVWVGHDAVMASVAQQLKALDTLKSTIRDLKVKMLASGKVAVATYLYDAVGKSGGEAFALKGVRVSVVLEKRSGTWLVVTSHNSVPVSGQAVKY